jgi:predicted nucleic acid-binding protein
MKPVTSALARQHKIGLLSKDRHFDRVKGIKRYDWEKEITKNLFWIL